MRQETDERRRLRRSRNERDDEVSQSKAKLSDGREWSLSSLLATTAFPVFLRVLVDAKDAGPCPNREFQTRGDSAAEELLIQTRLTRHTRYPITHQQQQQSRSDTPRNESIQHGHSRFGLALDVKPRRIPARLRHFRSTQRRTRRAQHTPRAAHAQRRRMAQDDRPVLLRGQQHHPGLLGHLPLPFSHRPGPMVTRRLRT